MNVYQNLMDQFKQDEDVIKVALIGSASDIDKKYFHKLADIDCFVVKRGVENFVREVIPHEGFNFNVSYIDIPCFERLIDKDNHHWIRLLAKSKTVFKRNEEADPYFKKVREIFFDGPDKLSEDDVNYYRFLLSNMFDDVKKRREREVEAEFLANIFVHEVLKVYFKLNNSWVPRDKKLLQVVFDVDIILYELIKASLKEQNLDQKIGICSDILAYVLKPYGGKQSIWERSEFPI